MNTTDLYGIQLVGEITNLHGLEAQEYYDPEAFILLVLFDELLRICEDGRQSEINTKDKNTIIGGKIHVIKTCMEFCYFNENPYSERFNETEYNKHIDSVCAQVGLTINNK